MARYRKIDPRIWNDERFRTLSERAKLAFLLVLTHPTMTCLGAMRGTVEGLAAELGWQPRTMRNAINELAAAGMIELNAAAAYVGAPRFLRYNEPEGPNSVTKAWVEAIDLVPECVEKQRLVERCRHYLRGRSDEFRRAITGPIWHVFGGPIPDGTPSGIVDGKSNPLRIQEQEPEQEKEEERDPCLPLALAPSNGGSDPEHGFGRFWKVYPRKRARKDALKAWLAARPDAALLERIVAAVLAQSKNADWQREGGKYIPHPATWLRGGRWEDELEVGTPSPISKRTLQPLTPLTEQGNG
jgi:hypothetical protein